MPRPLKILCLEDSEPDAWLLLRALRAAGYAPEGERVFTRDDFLAALDPSLDLVFVDHDIPGWSGEAALELLRDSRLGVPAIVVSGAIEEEAEPAALGLGATAYVSKDRLARLGAAVARALALRGARPAA